MEMLLFAMVFMLMGFRHGFDSDHMAAIADMVGTETTKGRTGRQVRLGLMYALGHGMIVLVVGMVAVFAGSRLPESVLEGMEMLVGLTLLVLGGAILISVIRNKKEYEYVSRYAMIYGWIRKWTGKRDKTDAKLRQLGILGAFVIGVIHGIGAETPTQIALISASAGLGDALTAALQIVLFTLGLLAATTLITLLASWGFTRARFSRPLSIGLGCLTGGYSLVLGLMIMFG